MKILQSFLFFFLMSTVIYAQDYASIYIEGDGTTPFYVKVEGKMQERLAKDYFIIPNLDAGYTNIEILFQQNIYPAQHFLIAIPSSGTRGFSLKKVNDNQFALYDLQQKRYIVAGNKKEDDWLSKVPQPNVAANDKNNQQIIKNTDDLKVSEALPKFEGDRKQKKVKEHQKDTEVVQVNEDNQQPKFISGIELNTDENQKTNDPNSNQNKQQNISSSKKRKRTGNSKEDIANLPVFKLDENGNLVKEEEPSKIRTDLPPVPNTDCLDAMDNDKFEDFATQFLEQQDDDAKLKFLRNKFNNYCFSTEQVRILGKNMNTQSGRYEEVKLLYIKTKDQENYGKLESLFNTDFLKSKFRELLKPQSN